MALTVEYNDKLTKNGAFIKPDGNFLLLKDNNHELFAQNYCIGHTLQKNEIIKDFSNTQLNETQIYLFRQWLNKVYYNENNKYTILDFYVLCLRFDKAEKIVRHTITTSSTTPHIRFYNYYLMDYIINCKNPLQFDPTTNVFFEQPNMLQYSYEDREAEEEIKEIVSRVRKPDRHLYFK